MAASIPTSGADGTAPLPLTQQQATFHDLLSNTRRILAIDALADDAVEADADGWVLLTDVADAVEDWLGIDDGDEDRRIYHAMYHSHVPKLVERGVIEQDVIGEDMGEQRRVVRPGPNFEAVLSARNAVALALGVSDDE